MPGFTSTALTDLDMWARGVPYDEFARLRRECPVAWFEEDAPNSGYWSVHRHQDIVTASRDVATFSSARGVSFEEPTDADMAADRFAMIWCGVLTLDRLGPYDPLMAEYERLGSKVLRLPDVIAQSVGFMGPVFSSAFVLRSRKAASTELADLAKTTV
jgi:hypothetical protein